MKGAAPFPVSPLSTSSSLAAVTGCCSGNSTSTSIRPVPRMADLQALRTAATSSRGPPPGRWQRGRFPRLNPRLSPSTPNSKSAGGCECSFAWILPHRDNAIGTDLPRGSVFGMKLLSNRTSTSSEAALPGSAIPPAAAATAAAQAQTRASFLAVLIRRVAAVQHQVVAVGVGEEGHVADAGVQGVAQELDAFGFQLLARGFDVFDVQRRVGVLLRGELEAHFRRLPDREAGVPDPELVLPVLVGAQAEGVDVEGARAVGVGGRDADEVELGDHVFSLLTLTALRDSGGEAE